jgi:hypothetical protein
MPNGAIGIWILVSFLVLAGVSSQYASASTGNRQLQVTSLKTEVQLWP